jgi:hypothetical protein
MRECAIDAEDVLVRGGVINAFLDAFGTYRTRGVRVLARHFGVEKLDPMPEGLYPVHRLLGGMQELQEQFGRGFMTRIGQSIYERAVFPPDLATLEVALAAVDTAYYMNHTNAVGRLGHYSWTQEGAGSGRMVCDNPYPCAFDMGIFAGMAKQFGVGVEIDHLDPETCRHSGADACTYRIAW